MGANALSTALLEQGDWQQGGSPFTEASCWHGGSPSCLPRSQMAQKMEHGKVCAGELAQRVGSSDLALGEDLSTIGSMRRTRISLMLLPKE